MSELLDIANKIVGWSQGDEQVEAYVVRSRELEIRAELSDVESLSSAEALGAGVRVIKDHRQGFAYAGSLDEDILRETLADARDNAGFGSPDEHFGLAEPDGVTPAELDVFREEVAATPTEAKVAMALELEQMVLADPQMRGARYIDYGDGLTEVAVASTTGIASQHRRGYAAVSAFGLAGEGEETMTGDGYSVGRAPSELDLEKAAGDTIKRATRMLGATKPSTARLTVVLEPEVTAGFLGIAGSMLNGESVLKGRSPFADRVGEEVAAAFVTLVDDPTNPLAFSASMFDGEGLASRGTPLIEDGVLRGFLHNAYTARRSGGASTGSAVRGGFKGIPGVGCRALQLSLGTKTQEELIAGIDNGLLVQSVSGLHSGVNPVSGDFSVGAEGLMIRNGVIAEPVREITIGSTIQRMLLDLVEVGGDVEWLPSNAHGVSVAIADVTMSGA